MLEARTEQLKTAGATPRQVLVVHPQAMLLDVVAAVLERAGFEVLTTERFVNGLELLNSTDVDLVLVSIGLHPTDEWKMFRDALREHHTGRVLVMSSFRERTEARELDAPVLHKPFRPQELVDAVDATLRGAIESADESAPVRRADLVTETARAADAAIDVGGAAC